MVLPLKYGIPDIELPRAVGGTVNPSCFAGHALAVVFCPTDRAAEVRELDDYARHASQFTGYDAWVLTVGGAAANPSASEACPVAAASDPDGRAWDAFRAIAGPPFPLRREDGATFLFGRGGALQHVRTGPGHAADLRNQLVDRGAMISDPPDLLVNG